VSRLFLAVIRKTVVIAPAQVSLKNSLVTHLVPPSYATSSNLASAWAMANVNREIADESVLSDVKSLYDVIIDRKRMSGNPKEPPVNRMVAVGELMDHYQRPDMRQKICAIYDRLAREISAALRSKGQDPLTGVLLVYPTQVLLIIESNSDSLRRIMEKWKVSRWGLCPILVVDRNDQEACGMEKNITMETIEPSPERIVDRFQLLTVVNDVNRQMRAFTSKVLNQPMPLPNWLPPGGLSENAAETLLIRILRQIQAMICFVEKNGKDRKVMDLLVEKKAESIPDQDALLFLSRSDVAISIEDYLDKYASPFNVTLTNDQTWPSNWPGKRLSCSVTFREEEPDEIWGADLGLGGRGTSASSRLSLGRLASAISKGGLSSNAAVKASAAAAYRKSNNSRNA